MLWLSRTPVAPLEGRVAITTGTVSVENVHTRALGRAIPATFLTAVVRVAVNVVFGASGPDGVNVAMAPEHTTAPATGPAALVTVKLVPPMTVEQFNAAPALSGSCAGSCRNVALMV